MLAVDLTLLSSSPSPFAWAYLGMLLLFFGMSILYRGVRRDPSTVKSSRSEYALFLAVNLAFIVLPTAYVVTPWFDGLDYALPLPLSIAGLAGLAIALLIRLKAHLDLGDSFTIAPGTTRAREMVTTGIYARVRHPMYLSMLIWALSTPLVLPNYLVGLLPLVSITAFLAIRLPAEERVLENEFGERYREYAARTGGLLPRMPR